MGEYPQATVCASEDMDWGHVLVDEHAPTWDAALAALIHTARVEWDLALTDEGAVASRRRWYRFDEDQDELLPCEPDDPRRDSEWWVFDLSMAEAA